MLFRSHWKLGNHPNREEGGGYQPVGVVSKLPVARRGFQHRLPTPRRGTGKTESGDDREGCCLVTIDAGGRQLLQGEEGGFGLWRLQDSKTPSF